MKKLAILLGTLAIAASAFAGAKESIPAPATTTVIKEVERVVYRDRTDIGSVTFRYQVLGPAGENKRHGTKYYRENHYAGDFGRLRIDGSLALTERVKFGFQIRTDHELGISDKDSGIRDTDRYRAWFDYKHDFLNATSRLWYQRNGHAGSNVDYTVEIPGVHNLDYKFLIPVAEYFFDNDFIKTTTFDIGPEIGYSWDYSNDKNGANTYGSRATYYGGLALYTTHKLPLNFTFDFNLFALYANTNHYYFETPTRDYKNDFLAYAEVYLFNKTKLFDLGDKATLSFVFEGGYDGYQFSQRKIWRNNFINKRGENTTQKYTLYALPTLRVDYAAASNLSIFVEAGAEYANGELSSHSAQGWTLSPYAQTGFTVKF
jgi:hypothetical protein